MSALTDLFTSMANKIRLKVGGSDTYTPTEMVSAIDDVYDAGYADATTPITPSNAEPVEILANTGYKPTANGYAIESIDKYIIPRDDAPFPIYADEIDRVVYDGYAVLDYNDIYPNNSTPASLNRHKIYLTQDSGYAIASYDSVTPSSTPTSVASGDIVKIGGSGKIVDAISDVTPSDSSPVSLTSGLTYKMGGGGYAIESQPSNKTPDDTNPPSVSSGEIVKMGGAGYAIASNPTSLFPSNTIPATITEGAIYRASASGIAVKSVASIAPSNSSPATIEKDKIYNATGNGYAISRYNPITPSDTDPTSLVSSGIYKPTATGYFYATKQGRKGTATSDGTANSEFTCDTGLSSVKKFVAWGVSGASNQNTAVVIYDYDLFGGLFSTASIQTSAATQRPRVTLGTAPTAYNGSIMSISVSGVVTIKNSSSAINTFKGTVYWYAEGT